jgi:haloacetate dehalogenase
VEAAIRLPDLTMNYRDSGDGPLLVLLHGWPQTSYCWRLVEPLLAPQFRVVAPDLRGYGLTDKPQDGYDKRRMAQDIRDLVDALGYDTVRLVGHDRGARVAHRFALDHPEVLTHLTLLDIVPTLHAFRTGTPETSQGYWHWLFHLRRDLPELLVGANIDGYLRYFFEQWTVQRHAVEDAVDHYVTAFSRPGALRAGFEDYRATIPHDLGHDAADHEAGRVVEIATQVLWGEAGLSAGPDVLEVWRAYAPQVSGGPVADCGHFLAEEQPEQLAELLLPYLTS